MHDLSLQSADSSPGSAILDAMGTAAERLMEAGPWDDRVQSVLSTVGSAASVSRAYVFENETDPRGVAWTCQRYEWVEEGVSPQIDNPALARVCYREAGLGRWETEMAAGRPIHGPVADLPPGEREILRGQDIRSIAVVPISVERRWWGFLGFDDCVRERAWTHMELSALRTVGALLGAVTGSERAHEALRRREDRFRRLVEATDEGILIHDGTRILDANPSLARLLGYELDDLLGRDPFSVVAPASLEVTRANFLAGYTLPYEIEGLRADGSTIPVEIRGSRFPDDGREVRVVSVRDLTERRAAEESERRLAQERAVREQAQVAEARAGFLAEASRILATSLDYHTTLTHLARFVVREMADYCAIDVLRAGEGFERMHFAHVDPAGERLLARLADLDLHKAPERHPVMRALHRGESTLIPRLTPDLVAELVEDPEHRALLRELHPRSVITVPMANAGRVMGALTVAITRPEPVYREDDLGLVEELGRRAALAADNARLFEDAQRATRARDEMLAVVAHDLRNPLAAVRMATEILLDEEAPSPAFRDHLETVEGSAAQMDRLIQDLLEAERLAQGRLDIHADVTPVRELLDEAAGMLGHLAVAAGIELLTRCPGDVPAVRADRGRTLQVLSNLVGNALKFTDEGGRVTLGCSPRPREVLLSVADTGRGISPEQLPHVFGRFWQADDRDRRGVGLGLAIAKGIVEAQGGRIWVESTAGVGSTFSFTLPTAAAEARDRPDR